jgi:cell division protease FtsH
MNKRSLAAKILAFALCVSLPCSASATQMRGEPVLKSTPGSVMPAAQLKVTAMDFGRALELHFPANFSTDAALITLAQAQAGGPKSKTGESAAARAILSAAAGKLDPAVLAAAAGPAQAEKLLAAVSAMRVHAANDVDFAKALAFTQPKTSAASNSVTALLKKAAGLFTARKIEEPSLVSVTGGNGKGVPGGKGYNLIPAGSANGSGAKTGPIRSRVPVSKKVAQLQGLKEKGDANAAAAEIESVLFGAEPEARVEVRLAAVRAAGEIGDAKTDALLIRVVKNPLGWYERREAAKKLGARAESVQGEARDAAIDALKGAAQARNKSLRNAAGWALERFGVDPKPFLAQGESLSKTLFGVKAPPAFTKPANNLTQGPGQNNGPKPGSWFKRLLIGGAIVWGLFWAMNAFSPKQPTPEQANPPAVVQVDKNLKADSSAAAPADSAKQAAPKLTQEESLQQIAEQSKRTADELAKFNKDRAEEKAKAEKSAGSAIGGMILNMVIMILLFVGVFWLIGKLRGGGMGGANQIRGQLSQVKNKFERPEVTFDDVAGIDDAREEIEEIVDYLHNPAKYAKHGGRVPKGVLLEGPPGTGKTLLARALAGESGAAFFSVSGSDFIEMFVGVGASRVRELFQQAKQHRPAIIFIDEIDAVAKRRDGGKMSGGNDEREQTLNAILAEMGGFEDSSGVIVMAATNRADVLDPAITRPGRFDRKIHVGLPDVLGREAILAVHARNGNLAPEADLQFIAKRTAGYSGAFLEGITNEAALLAGRMDADNVNNDILNEAVDRVTIGAKRNLFMPEALKRRVAFHESGHVIAGMLAGGVPPNKVTVIPHGGAALGFAEPGGQEDRYLYTKSELEARLVGILGGLAAEEVIYGEWSTGPDNDLEQATNIARRMVERWAMSDKAGFSQKGADEYGRKLTSEETARVVDAEVERLVKEAKDKAVNFLKERKDALDKMTEELMERETLSGDDAVRILGPAKK